jgi:hypothetical protein
MIAAAAFIIGGMLGWFIRDVKIEWDRQRREDRIFRDIQDRAEREARP